MRCLISTILLSGLFILSAINCPAIAQEESFRDRDSLLRLLSTAKSDTSRLLLKSRLGEAYRSNNPDSAFLLATEALEGSKKTGFRKGETHALILLCVLYREKGDLPYALELGLEALRLSQNDGYTYGEIYSLIRTGLVYFSSKDIQLGMSYFRQAEAKVKKNYNEFQSWVTQYFLAEGYLQMNKPDSAESILRRIDESHGKEATWIVINNRLWGNIALKKNQPEVAIAYYKKSLDASVSGGTIRESATTANALAQVFKKLNQRDSAIAYALKALQWGEMLGYRTRVQVASSLLAELYAGTDPYRAVKYYRIAADAKDSMYGAEKFQQLQSFTMKERVRQNQHEAERLAYRNKVKQLSFLGGAIILMVIALILYRNNRHKQRAKTKIEQAYQDLQTAQSKLKDKNRELEIESAVERVRSAAMAMHQSAQILDVVVRMKNELAGLNLPGLTAVTLMIKQDDGTVRFWDITATTENELYQLHDFICEIEEADPAFYLRKIWFAKEKFLVQEQDANSFEITYNWLNQYDAESSANALNYIREHNIERSWHPAVPLTNGKLNLDFIKQPPPETQVILTKMAAGFDLAYQRFNDLKRAEAQSREARIEAGLERVRSRAMAMQKSEELALLIGTVFTELNKLDITTTRCLIMIYDPETKASKWWMANSEDPDHPAGFFVPFHEHEAYLSYLNAWAVRQLKYTYILKDEIKDRWDDYLFVETDLKLLPVHVIEGMKKPRRVYLNSSFNNFGNLSLVTLEPLSDESFSILLRFAGVFDLTYTRFYDLQKAEANAHEAKIEASLERVRAKAMGMHSSQDLADTIGVFYRELTSFSITPRRCGVGLLRKETRIAELFTWNTTETGESLEVVGKIKMENHPVLEGVYANWLTQTEFKPVLRGKEITEYYRLVRPQISFPDYTDEVQYGYFFFFDEGGVYAWTETEMKEEELQIYRRFTSVLSLTYKRYKDLQQAEEDLVKLQTEKKRAEDALSELQSAQKQLIQAEKMASLGELTAGIAHEIQNPLNFVNNFSEVNKELLSELKEEAAKNNMGEVKQLADDIIANEEKIHHHGRRADAIVKSMLQHSSAGAGKKEAVDLNAMADEYIRLAYHGLRAKDKSFNAKIETHFDPAIKSVEVVPQDMGRVFLNLLNNAFYAVSNGKRSPELLVTTEKQNDKIKIIVKDNGGGIPPDVIDKIFQPFFTTKPTGQGTGLGLSLSYDIIKAHGGEITVMSTEGKGTEFSIQIPQ